MMREASIFFVGLLLAATLYAQDSSNCDYDKVLKNIPKIETAHVAKPLVMRAYIFPLGDYTVQVFSPYSWIVFNQEQAKKTLSTYSPGDSDMKDILRVAIAPPDQLSGIAQNGGLNIGVVNAVLRSTDQSVTLTPLCSTHAPVSFQNNMGAKWSFDSMFLLFDIRDIRKQLTAGKKMEISIVVGTGKVHDFVLTQKQLATLELQ